MGTRQCYPLKAELLAAAPEDQVKANKVLSVPDNGVVLGLHECLLQWKGGSSAVGMSAWDWECLFVKARPTDC